MKIFQENFPAKYIFMVFLALASSPAFSQVSLSIDIAPPPLQVYSQPACPDDGYIWTPGYWAYGDSGYYWVPGAWVQPPEIGVYWTPPYWGWNGNAFAFYSGYWGQNVGYYGGINYGYGYGGRGYGGGRWQGNHFSYNTAVNNVSSAHVHYTYADRTAIHSNASKVSYNGGKGGVQATPTAHQRQVAGTHLAQPTSAHQSAVKTQQVVSAKSSTESSSNRQIEAVKHTSVASTHATPSHVPAAKSQTHTVAYAKPQSQPQTHAQPQFHPAAHAPAQSQRQTHAQPQSHPQAQAQAQTHAPQPQSHAAAHAKP